MMDYKVLFRDPATGGLLCSQSLAGCGTDRAALAALKRLQGHSNLELWDGSRLVAVRGLRGRPTRQRRATALALAG